MQQNKRLKKLAQFEANLTKKSVYKNIIGLNYNQINVYFSLLRIITLISDAYLDDVLEEQS